MRRQLLRQLAMATFLLGFIGAGVPETEVPERARAMPDGKVIRKIKRFQRATWRWQRVMGVPRTPNRKRYLKTRDRRYRLHVLRQWRQRAIRAKRRAHNPPHEVHWRCIQRYEAKWTDDGDPYWGGLQMDRAFMRTYAPRHLLRRGWANTWTAVEQMWVAERALRAGRGFYPWPNAARICDLI